MRISFFVALVSLVGSVNAKSAIDTVGSFERVKAVIEQGLTKPESTLIAFDIDNTLLTTWQDLGSDIWYSWQAGNLPLHPDSNQKVNCFYEDAIGMLYELSSQKIIDTTVASFVKKIQVSGAKVIALTSRSPNVRSATERELNRNDIDFNSSRIKSSVDGSSDFLFKVPKGREVTYRNGVFMGNGQDKGKMLRLLLEITQSGFRKIIFVDDTYKNVVNIHNEFKNDNIDVEIVYYTEVVDLIKKRNGGQELTPAQAKDLDRKYKSLMQAVYGAFPNRVKGECLDKR